jgi:hypothetical protein
VAYRFLEGDSGQGVPVGPLLRARSAHRAAGLSGWNRVRDDARAGASSHTPASEGRIPSTSLQVLRDEEIRFPP